ncbi:RDD family protein [Halobacillus massiliensis]|uniref:RDD family protein n=1 Tax=Halobacillus massiliensis TaxID=1926286 RepID=UPI0009E25E50|nr:RDD family protein [Halobacillus massiliensis]
MTPASFKLRIYAFLLDYLLISLYGTVVIGSISIIFRQSITPLFTESPVAAELTGFLFITMPVVLYFVISEQSHWQGTFGKRKLGLMVTDKKGGRISFFRSLARSIIKFSPWELAHFVIWRLMLPTVFSGTILYIILISVNICIIAFLIVPLTNRKKQNIYDFAAKTIVVRCSR